MILKTKFWASVMLAMIPLAGLKAQLSITANQTAATLASQLVGPGVVVTNPTLTCPTVANGIFSGGTSPLGIGSGIILTTGSATGANNTASFFSSDNNGAGGDANLQTLAGQSTFDACVLQFDFVAQGTSVKFDYQFGSEEYPNYSCTNFNDVFAFFLTGPGYPSATNLAVLPNTNTPVTINSTTGFSTCNPNHPYFINNVNGPKPAYDGLTTVLSAQANITAGSTYHLKIGVADAGDGSYNSGVFLKQGSLTVGPPVVTGCPGNIASCNPVVSWTPPTASSPGLTVTTTTNHNPGETFPVGNTTVTYTFDNGYSTSTCTFTVTVNQAPTITSCPGDILTTTNTNNCSRAVTYTVAATGSPTPTFTHTFTGATTGSGSGTGSGTTFNKGVTNVSVTATNTCGNSSSCNFTITVNDATAPVPTLASLATVTGQCSASVTAPTANDNCSGTIIGTTVDPTSYNAQGTYTVHWTYTDASNNTTSQNQTVIVHDVTAPVPDIASLPNVTGECSASATAPTATDNCVGTVIGTTLDPTSYSAQGTYTIHWTYNDGNGNTSTQNQTVVIHDVTAPVPDMAALPDVTGECSATATAPTATDNCVGSVTATTLDPTSYSAQGTYTIHWTYSDGNGNSSTQTQNVIVHDVTAPVPALASLSDVNAECSATVTAPTATDNCVGSVTATTTDPTTYSTQGSFTIHWTYSDANGNTSTQTQNVNIHDVTAPVPNVPSLSGVTAECSATVTAPTATDNCSGTITATTADPTTYSAQGAYTIHWTYNDGNGNTSSQNQTVIVRDVTPPTISGTPANINVNNDAGQCGAIVSWTAPTTSDNCSSTITQTAGLASGSQFPVGTTTITYTATDAGGNTVTSSFDVAVTDNENPTITAPSNVTINGWCTNTTADLGTPVTGDNCGVASVTNNAPATFPVGTTTVTWTVTDVHGHTATANQTVTVNPATVTGSFNTEPDRITAACPGGYILWGYDTNISVSVSGGTAPYSYNWTAGATGSTATGTFGTTGNPPAAFTVVVTDAHACSVTLTKTTCITDVRCGNNVNMDHKVTICHKAGNKWNTICVDQDAVPAHLAHGDMIGACNLARHGNVVSEEDFQVFPNPNNGSFTVTLVENADSKVVVTDMFGKVIFTKAYSAGTPTINVSMPGVATGMYFLAVQNGDSSFKTKISVE
jgi:hypothetical protein